MVMRSSEATEYVEEWRPVPQWPYEASNAGRVRRVGAAKPLISWLNPYPTVAFSVGNKKTNQLIHRLVWMAFHGAIPSGMTINHLDGIKTNNALCNLELATPKENTAHAIRNGLFSMGERHHVRRNPAKYTYGANNGFAKYSEVTVLEVKRRLASGERSVDIAVALGVSANWIASVKRGRLWKHLIPQQSAGHFGVPAGARRK